MSGAVTHRYVYPLAFTVRNTDEGHVIDEIACGQLDVTRVSESETQFLKIFRVRIDHSPAKYRQANYCSDCVNQWPLEKGLVRLPEALVRLREFVVGSTSNQQFMENTYFLVGDRALMLQALQENLKLLGVKEKKWKNFQAHELLNRKNGEHNGHCIKLKTIFALKFRKEKPPEHVKDMVIMMVHRFEVLDQLKRCLSGGACAMSDINALRAISLKINFNADAERLVRQGSVASTASFFQNLINNSSGSGRTAGGLSPPNLKRSQQQEFAPSAPPNLYETLSRYTSSSYSTETDTGNPCDLDLGYDAWNGLVYILRFSDDPMFVKDAEAVRAVFERLSHVFSGSPKVVVKDNLRREDLEGVREEIKRHLATRSYLACFAFGHGGVDDRGEQFVNTFVDPSTAVDPAATVGNSPGSSSSSPGQSSPRIFLNEDLLVHFNNINCRVLKGKARFFFCQMCRGSDTNEAIPTVVSQTQDQQQQGRASASASPRPARDSSPNRLSVWYDPREADFLVWMSSVGKTESHGHGHYGSPVTQEFCMVLDKYPTADIDKIFKEVRRRLDKAVVRAVDSAGNLSSPLALVPEIVKHSLSKDFRFFQDNNRVMTKATTVTLKTSKRF